MTDRAPNVSVSGGGTITVETPTMLAAARQLEDLEATLRHVVNLVVGLSASPQWMLLPTASRVRASGFADDAATSAATCARQAVDIGEALRRAAATYGMTEHTVSAVVEAAAGGMAASWGAALRMATLCGPAAVLDDVLVTAGVGAVAVEGLMIEELLTTGRVDLLDDPLFIDGLRLTISSLDDGLRGFFALEQPRDLVQNDPARPFSTASIADALAGVMTALARSDPRVVATRDGDSVPMPPPDSLHELIDRLPIAAPNAHQMRIERYDDGDGVRWIVYVAGTVTFSPFSGNEPFDMASNLQAVGGAPSASQAGVEAAMRDAGVQPGQPVLLVGHSQGATVVERIAQSGDFDVQGVVTAGGPTGGITLPAAIPVLAVEHTDDLVPALSGVAAGGAAGLNRTLVQRRVYGREVAPDPTVPVDPAHQNSEYSQTLTDAENSGSAKVRAFRSRVAVFLTGSNGTAADWRADRMTGTPADSVPISLRPGSGR